MRYSEPVALRRDVDAIQIPYGTPMRLQAGSEVRITQALGDTFTVVTDDGYMVRINHSDADALGKEDEVAREDKPEDKNITHEEVEKRVWEALRTTYDPEIPVNIVELGLVYSCIVNEIPGTNSRRVALKITLTAPGCGMGPVLADDIRRKVLNVPTIEDVLVDVVWEPQWDQSMMSEAARLQLGL